MTKTLNKADLAQFTGSENWYRHAINRAVLFTDGAKYVADQAGAYWLLDEIAIIQPHYGNGSENTGISAFFGCKMVLHSSVQVQQVSAI